MTEVTGKRRKEPRYDEFAIPTYRKPVWSDTQLVEFNKVARNYADRNRSDPFAYGRALAHLKRGLADPSDFSGGGTS